MVYDGEGHKMPILAVVGIDVAGDREVLAFTVGELENQTASEDLLDDIKGRGVQQVDCGSPMPTKRCSTHSIAASQGRRGNAAFSTRSRMHPTTYPRPSAVRSGRSCE